jgi:hypothetical protein
MRTHKSGRMTAHKSGGVCVSARALMETVRLPSTCKHPEMSQTPYIYIHIYIYMFLRERVYPIRVIVGKRPDLHRGVSLLLLQCLTAHG